MCKYSSYKKGYNCEAKMKTIFKNGRLEVFTNDKDHAHEKIGERKNVNFSKEAEERIEELINLDVTRKKHQEGS